MMAQIPRAEKGLICPFHKKDQSLVCHKCPLWVKIEGKNPQSEQRIETWACSFAVMPWLLVENSQMQRQTGAAVESFRNEWVGGQADAFNRLTQIAEKSPKQINGR
jgi:hypothetical protein